jgi:hypothetical protein
MQMPRRMPVKSISITQMGSDLVSVCFWHLTMHGHKCKLYCCAGVAVVLRDNSYFISTPKMTGSGSVAMQLVDAESCSSSELMTPRVRPAHDLVRDFRLTANSRALSSVAPSLL